jgi:hypothetical protein
VRRAARLLALLGAVALGFFLFRSSTREVVLVYDLAGAPGVRALEVVLQRDGKVVRRARFEAPAAQVRHPVRLTDGSYRLGYRVETPGEPLQGERTFTVTEAGTIVLALGR